MAGETHLGPFAIERELGRGGFGVVYAATKDGRRVALKVALEELAPRQRKHFFEEADILARISHPAVVEILESGTLDDGRPYVVMPLLEGRTLSERLREGPLDPELALRLFAQLASAVAALHDAGIIHRDIKPENVMFLEDQEQVVLLDFGIARDLDAPMSTTTRRHWVRGTPGCMAPERVFGVRASPASDVYELALVLFVMLVGELPWDDPMDVEARLRPRHPAELGVRLPVGIGHALLEALAPKPELRPSVRELAVRLRAIEAADPGTSTRLVPVRAPPAFVVPAMHVTPVTPAAPVAPITPHAAKVHRARSIAPASSARASPRRRTPVLAWTAGVALTALTLGGSFAYRAARDEAASLPPARAGVAAAAHALRLALVSERSLARTGPPPSAPAPPAPSATASASATPAAAHGPRSAAAVHTTRVPAPEASPPPASPPPAPTPLATATAPPVVTPTAPPASAGPRCGSTTCGSAASCCVCRGWPICISLRPGATCAQFCQP